MAKHTYADIMAQHGAGFARGSLTPEQAKVAYQVRQHSEYSLHQAKAEARVSKYTSKELKEMSDHVPLEDLTKVQEEEMDKRRVEKMTPAKIAKLVPGFPQEIIEKRVNSTRFGGIDPNSLIYRPSRGFFGKTRDGVEVVLYGTRGGLYDVLTFGLAEEIEDIVRLKKKYPGDENLVIYIPLKDGHERNNLTEV